jgi:hypothetical protein
MLQKIKLLLLGVIFEQFEPSGYHTKIYRNDPLSLDGDHYTFFYGGNFAQYDRRWAIHHHCINFKRKISFSGRQSLSAVDLDAYTRLIFHFFVVFCEF